MPNSSYFRQQADRCLRLARECTDGTVSERLRQMAAEFIQQMEQVQRLQGRMPQQANGRPGAGSERD